MYLIVLIYFYLTLYTFTFTPNKPINEHPSWRSKSFPYSSKFSFVKFLNRIQVHSFIWLAHLIQIMFHLSWHDIQFDNGKYIPNHTNKHMDINFIHIPIYQEFKYLFMCFGMSECLENQKFFFCMTNFLNVFFLSIGTPHNYLSVQCTHKFKVSFQGLD